MNFNLHKVVRTLGVLTLIAANSAWAGTPFPTKATAEPADVGSLTDLSGATPVTVTLSLKLRDEQAASDLAQSVYTKGDANFHQFLTPAQFKSQFGQSDADVAAAAAHLAAYGVTVQRSGASTLRVTGSPAALESVFQVRLHVYEVPASASAESYRFFAPTTAAKIPTEVSAVVDGVVGLSTRPQFAPHLLRAPLKYGALSIKQPQGTAALADPLGSLTVLDFEKYYDVDPLIKKGLSGKGRTLGIVTLASFTESDAYAYWSALGLNVSKDRIKVINIDGGPGAPSDASGSLETTIDVEQSGGIAPGANIIVYQAPNTNQAFLDAFVHAVEDNSAESISVSWGEWEWFENLANSPVTDPFTGETVGELRAFHEIFLQAALQGQSMFAAAGDAGAYDANDGATPPDWSLALSVDNPASDPYITAAGGTTLAGTQEFALPNKKILSITVPVERVWGWDYLIPLCDALQLDPIECGIFPVGSGGGVSFEFALPFYQADLAGTQKTQPDQSYIDEDTIPPTTLLDLPANYAGRNVPDVSFNADPDTGYVVYYTSSVTGFGKESFWGGTSFVGPQLNGVTGLIGEDLHSRLGLLNAPLYDLARQRGAYTGSGASFNAITHGNNDFYYGRDGYSPAVGIGTINVSHLATALGAD
jgi:subtilase family serine protease